MTNEGKWHCTVSQCHSEPAGHREPKVGHELLLRRLRLAAQPLDSGGEFGLLADGGAALRDELRLRGR